MGRKCAVPHCYTGYRKCTEKASLYRVPDDDYFLSKWQEAIAREDRLITPKDYVCEKHFKDDDILRRRVIKDVVEQYQRPRLKPDAIPSIFPDLPEFILKMVKKRRKIPMEDPKSEVCGFFKHEQIENVKTEPLEANDENIAGMICETILSNELDIKSEPEENVEQPIENCGENDGNVSFNPKLHRCDQCDYETKYPHNLKSHKVKHRTDDDAYIRCEHCPNFKTKWEITYRNHLKSKHGTGKEETFKCTVCPFETKLKSSLKRHLKRHQELGVKETWKKNLYTCSKCSYKSKQKNKLLKHVIKHKSKSDSVWKCLKCTFATFSQESESGNQLFICTECGFKWQRKLESIKHSLTYRNVSMETLSQRNIVGQANYDGNKTDFSWNGEEKWKKIKNEDSEAGEPPAFVPIKSEISHTGRD